MDITITHMNADLRIDRYLRFYLKFAPLSQIYRLLRTGKVKVNRKKIKQDYRLKAGDIINFHFDVQPFLALPPGKQPVYKQRFTVLHEDKDLLIIDKPAGLASHGGT